MLDPVRAREGYRRLSIAIGGLAAFVWILFCVFQMLKDTSPPDWPLYTRVTLIGAAVWFGVGLAAVRVIVWVWEGFQSRDRPQ